MSIKLKPEINARRCQFCGYIFSKKCNLFKHLRENRCPDQKKSESSNQTLFSQSDYPMLSQNDPQHNQSISIHDPQHNQSISINDHQHNQSIAINDHQHNQSISINDDLKTMILSLNKKIEELTEKQTIGNQKQENIEKYIEQLKENPNSQMVVNNNVLQVVCVTQNDNYLDILTQQMGDFDKALEYIKNCALGNICGDCQLIKGKPLLNPFKQLEQ